MQPAFEWMLTFCYHNILHLLYTVDTAILNYSLINECYIKSIG